jgi:DNA-binding GntR family transcriptional regulator
VRVYDAIAAADAPGASAAMRSLVDLALEDTKLAMER